LERRKIGIVLVVLGIIGLLAFPLYAALTWGGASPQYGGGSPWNQGMMGQWPWWSGSQTQIGFDEAVTQFENYIVATGNRDLALKEVMEFQYNYYAIVYEKSTGIGAFELLVDKADGYGRSGMGGMMGGGMMGRVGLVYPEPGPNMMWNTKYGMMQGMMSGGMMGSRRGYISVNPGASVSMPVTVEQAESYAMKYLSQYLSGASLEEPDQFYGYYTIHVLKDGKIYGMLSVNGYSGDVWYHSWHGYFIQEQDFE